MEPTRGSGAGQKSNDVVQRLLFRGMQVSAVGAATPLQGNDSGFQLGVRADEYKMQDDNINVKLQSGGMSTSKVRGSVPNFTKSKSYTGGSHGTGDQAKQAFRWVWSFDETTKLPATLTTRNDHDDHVMLEPGQDMTPAAFKTAVQGTQAHWTQSPPP